jgi:D-alanine--poly(phosphoribitol) ligase subunit 2
MKNEILRDDLLNLVLRSVELYCDENGIAVDINKREDLRLFGGEGLLDSLGLVSLIVQIEEEIEDRYNLSVVLADEKAMSRRTSPFAKVSFLVDYIFEILNQN